MIRIASKIVEVEVFNTFHAMFCGCALPMSLVVHPEEFDLIKYLIIKHVWKYLRVTSSWFMNPHFCQPWYYRREGTSSWRCIIGYKLHTMTKLKWWAILYNSCIKYFKAFTIINVKSLVWITPVRLKGKNDVTSWYWGWNLQINILI